MPIREMARRVWVALKLFTIRSLQGEVAV